MVIEAVEYSMNYEAILWMQNHKHLYDSALELAEDCTAMLNLWQKDKFGYPFALPQDLLKEAKKIIR